MKNTLNSESEIIHIHMENWVREKERRRVNMDFIQNVFEESIQYNQES